jgi:hypothetical protein
MHGANQTNPNTNSFAPISQQTCRNRIHLLTSLADSASAIVNACSSR